MCDLGMLPHPPRVRQNRDRPPRRNSRRARSLPDPEVVGVEELVLVRVLEGRLVVFRALRRLAQDELPVALALGEVPALLVALGPATIQTISSPHNTNTSYANVIQTRAVR